MQIFENIEAFRGAISLSGNIIGIDYGKKKIGLSISSPSRSMALPFALIENYGLQKSCKSKPNNKKLHPKEPDLNRSFKNVHEKIFSLIKNKNVVAIVIGLPIHIDGTESETTRQVRIFSASCYEYFKLPIYFQEERRTSRAADSLLEIAGFSRRERNELDDSVAATLILDSALNHLMIKD